MPTKTATVDPIARAWEKLTKASFVDRAGAIPIFDDGQWRTLRNTHTIYAGAENCADPVKVEQLRQNVESLYRAYPQTVEQLEKLGIRVKRLLAHPIKTQADVTAWANSLFNVGPMTYPDHVFDTMALAYDDFPVRVPHKEKTYVVPDSPRGSGSAVLRDFNEPGSKITFGVRHPYSKVVFGSQNGVARATGPAGPLPATLKRAQDQVRAKTAAKSREAHKGVTPPLTPQNGSEGPTGASEGIQESATTGNPVSDPEEWLTEATAMPEPPKRRGRLQSVA